MKGDVYLVSATVQNIVKHSVVYSFCLSQPFAMYVDAYPAFQNKLLFEKENLQYGEKNETVHILQKKLNNLSYYDDPIDGKFGVLTEHSLKRFQSSHNIEVTGTANKETMEALIEEEKQFYLDQINDLSTSISPGMYSEDVKKIQIALQYFGYYEGNIDGIYGPLTKQAIKTAEEDTGRTFIEGAPQQSMLHIASTEDSVQNEVDIEEESQNKKDEEQIKQVSVEMGTNHSAVIEEARSHIGTPYTWGGENPDGFDCSGFIQFVFQQSGYTIPRTVSDIWNFATPIDSPSVGDLVFFETYKPGPSHMGIYLGDGKFIHAGESRGVEISELSLPYWEERYLGAKRIN